MTSAVVLLIASFLPWAVARFDIVTIQSASGIGDTRGVASAGLALASALTWLVAALRWPPRRIRLVAVAVCAMAVADLAVLLSVAVDLKGLSGFDHVDFNLVAVTPGGGLILALLAAMALLGLSIARVVGTRSRAATMGAQPAGSPPPGWYPDPQGQHRLRWWTGTGWTDHVTG
ncbi:MAG: DUF2510 domain-containing protein [Actinomycetota bacterium]|nr:DUF2510 domain-containing protein [Actinomycetota bacterium]